MVPERKVESSDAHPGSFIIAYQNSKSDCEFSGYSHSLKQSYLITIKSLPLFGAVFTVVPPKTLKELVRQRLPIALSGTNFLVTREFTQSFIRLVRGARADSSRFSLVLSVTIQQANSAFCLIGQDPGQLQLMAHTALPTDFRIDPDSVRGLSCDIGRKIGNAAKDRTQLRNQLLTAETLSDLEAAGVEVAEQTVTRERLLPRWTLEELRAECVPPIVAWLLIKIRRMLPKRPGGNRQTRKNYLTLLPEFFRLLRSCRDLAQARTLITTHAITQNIINCGVGGKRFGYFCKHPDQWVTLPLNDNSEKTTFAGSEADTIWQKVAEDLQVRRRPAAKQKLPMPTRDSAVLSALRRIGSKRPAATQNLLIMESGLTGIEQGRWVNSGESQVLMQWVSESCGDLMMLLGPWFIDLCRRGNLGLALGARGHGRAAAHYDGYRRVINLTKLRGDGSLAHEFGHFLDQMIAFFCSEGRASLLSERIAEGISPRSAVSLAMARLCGSIGLIPTEHDLEGNPNADKCRYSRKNILRLVDAYDGDLKSAFGSVVASNPKRFQESLFSEADSQSLADSIAICTNCRFQVNTRVRRKTKYLQHAITLGRYWSRPRELFARAFESWCEDQLHQRNLLNEFLVHGTRRNFSMYRANPYPVGSEREEINCLVGELVAVCRTTVEGLSRKGISSTESID
ncbi:MAG: LPD1 domain-containing protein [Planctomyces sp.]